MKVILMIFSLFIFCSCFQQSNSTISDDASSVADANSTESFAGVYQIIQENCFNCHYAHTFKSTNSEEGWLALNSDGKKLITPGNPDASNLVIRTRNCGTDPNEANMPDNGQSISLEDCETIREWISSLSN